MKRFRYKPRLTIFFVLLNLTINFLSLLLLWGIGAFLVHAGLVQYEGHTPAGRLLVIAVLSVSQLLSCSLISTLISRWSLKPINKTIEAMSELERGNFSARLEMNGTKGGSHFAASFNRLAEELENTELLRSDFINNFSHEFKTPIVSILGFSRLLKKGACTPEEQREYLDIIEEESLRLSQMAANVLQMTKIENTSILSNVTIYNLSEQLRNCLLLLEKRWSAKDISLNLDFSEFTVSANEDLLKEVWINLLDNAVKFTPEGGEISVNIRRAENDIVVSVSNTGDPIPEADISRIFGKFYQADTSHAVKGAGLGLSIARQIVTLHGGTIDVTSGGGQTVFTVTLPQ